MRAPIIIVFLTLLGCEREAPQPAKPSGSGGQQSTAQAAAVPKATVEVDDVSEFLVTRGILVKSVTTMGPMSKLSCAASKHDRVLLADDAQVEVSRFANQRAAQECLAALRKELGEGWPAVSQDYLVRGHWLVVSAWDFPAADREKIQHAFEHAD